MAKQVSFYTDLHVTSQQRVAVRPPTAMYGLGAVGDCIQGVQNDPQECRVAHAVMLKHCLPMFVSFDHVSLGLLLVAVPAAAVVCIHSHKLLRAAMADALCGLPFVHMKV